MHLSELSRPPHIREAGAVVKGMGWLRPFRSDVWVQW